MRKSSAVLAAVLLGLANVGMAADTSTGTTDPSSDMQMNDSSNMQNDSSTSNDSSMNNEDSTKNSGSSATEGRTTGKGKQLNKGKTQTKPVKEGGRIEH
jgi:hypothetical protein